MTQCMLSVCMLHHSVMSNKQTKLERNKSTENDGERKRGPKGREEHTQLGRKRKAHRTRICKWATDRERGKLIMGV